jgi:hypothetical protein
MNGTHVFVNGDGEVVLGPPSLVSAKSRAVSSADIEDIRSRFDKINSQRYNSDFKADIPLLRSMRDQARAGIQDYKGSLKKRLVKDLPVEIDDLLDVVYEKEYRKPEIRGTVEERLSSYKDRYSKDPELIRADIGPYKHEIMSDLHSWVIERAAPTSEYLTDPNTDQDRLHLESSVVRLGMLAEENKRSATGEKLGDTQTYKYETGYTNPSFLPPHARQVGTVERSGRTKQQYQWEREADPHFDDAVLRMYAHTQARLGPGSTLLYRGVGGDYADQLRRGSPEPMFVLNSWTDNPGAARKFSNLRGGGDGVVMKSEVDHKRVLVTQDDPVFGSIFKSETHKNFVGKGLPSLDRQREYLVIGTPMTVTKRSKKDVEVRMERRDG